MRIDAYLAALGKSQTWLAGESGVSQQAISLIIHGGKTTVTTGRKLVEASRRFPTPDGGAIEWEDLDPEDEPEERAG